MSVIMFFLSAIGIGLVDSSDPLGYVLIFKIFTTKKPIKNFLYFIIPYWTLVVALGLTVLFLGTGFINNLENILAQAGHNLYLYLGLIIIALGIHQFFAGKKKENKKEWKLQLEGIGCSTSALILFVINMPLFILYIGLVLSLIKSDIDFTYKIITIFIYSFSIIAPYILAAILYKKYKVRLKAFISKIFNFLGNKYILGTILILIGLYLIFG